MPDIDRTVVLEAISALTKTTVKPLTKGCRRPCKNAELTTDNFLQTVFSSANSTDSASSLPSLINNLSLSSQSENSEPCDLPTNEKSALRKELFVDIENFLDSPFDFDFRYGSYSGKCSRGGEPYTRPWGWYRFALKVRNKYPDGNTWLGSGGWRSQSSPGEWPVSFHGTSIEGAKGIASSHYRAGEEKAFGRGIYSTPDINVARSYVKQFKSQNGKTYEVIMQNRINPEKRIITSNKDYWLIPVAKNTPEGEEEKIAEKSIRPYGILIREV